MNQINYKYYKQENNIKWVQVKALHINKLYKL
jgi:hypothetical protein